MKRWAKTTIATGIAAGVGLVMESGLAAAPLPVDLESLPFLSDRTRREEAQLWLRRTHDTLKLSPQQDVMWDILVRQWHGNQQALCAERSVSLPGALPTDMQEARAALLDRQARHFYAGLSPQQKQAAEDVLQKRCGAALESLRDDKGSVSATMTACIAGATDVCMAGDTKTGALPLASSAFSPPYASYDSYDSYSTYPLYMYDTYSSYPSVSYSSSTVSYGPTYITNRYTTTYKDQSRTTIIYVYPETRPRPPIVLPIKPERPVKPPPFRPERPEKEDHGRHGHRSDDGKGHDGKQRDPSRFPWDIKHRPDDRDHGPWTVSAKQQSENEERQRAEERRRQEEGKRQAEEQRRQEEGKRQAEEQRRQEEGKRQAEEQRRQEEGKRQAEEQRRQEEGKRQAEEQRRQEEGKRQAEEQRRQEEGKRQAEEQRRQEEGKRQAEEQRRQEEGKRQAEEQRRQEEGKRQAEEQRRQAEAQQRAEEQRRQAEAQQRAAEQQRQDEARRQAEEQRRQSEGQRR